MKLANRYPCAKWISRRSKPASSLMPAALTKSLRTRFMSARPISFGTWLCGK